MKPDDIARQLASKFSGLSMKKKEEPKVEEPWWKQDPPPRSAYTPPSGSSFRNGSSSFNTKLYPSERMALDTRPKPVPRREPVIRDSFGPEEWDWMLDTPCKRGWTFDYWLEVIGLPTDLHKDHDKEVYARVAKAYLEHKNISHKA